MSGNAESQNQLGDLIFSTSSGFAHRKRTVLLSTIRIVQQILEALAQGWGNAGEP